MSQCYVSLADYMTHWKGVALAAVQPARRIYVGPNRRIGPADRRTESRRDDASKGRRYRLCDRRSYVR